MYTSDQFLQNAETFTDAKITPDSVSELREVSRSNALEAAARRRSLESTWNALNHSLRDSPSIAQDINLSGLTKNYLARHSHDSFDMADIEKSVFHYLSGIYEDVIANSEFPDFIVRNENGRHGFEVKFVRNFERLLFPPPVVQAMLRGYFEVGEGNIDKFSLILVISQSDLDSIFENQDDGLLFRRAQNLIDKYPVSSLIIGIYSKATGFSQFDIRTPSVS